MKKRFFAGVLVLVMIVSLLPATAFADEAVAYIEGGIAYTSLGEAMADAGNGDTVVLMNNVPKTGFDVFGTKTNTHITLDLNGYSLYMNSGNSIEVKGTGNTLTIAATNGGSVVNTTGTQMFDIDTANGASVELAGGTYVLGGASASLAGNSAASAVTILDGAFSWNIYMVAAANNLPYTVYDGQYYTYYTDWTSAYAAYQAVPGSVISTTGDTSAATDVTVVLDYGYELNGAAVRDSISVKPGTTIVLPDGGAREGYTFAGWVNNNVPYAAGDDVTVGNSATITFTAQWTGVDCTVGYYDYDHASDWSFSAVRGTQIMVDGVATQVADDMQIPTAAKAGYTFLGWEYALVDGTHTLTSRFAKNVTATTTYGTAAVLTLPVGAAFTATNSTYFSVAAGSDAVLSQTDVALPAGTYTDLVQLTDATGAFVAAFYVTLNVVQAEQDLGLPDVELVVGDWTANTLIAADGASVTYESTNPLIATVDQYGNVTAIAEGETTIIATVGATGNYAGTTVSYKVTVSARTYSVSFNLNGGTGITPYSQNVVAGGTATAPSVTEPTLEGHVFLGWATTPYATTPDWDFYTSAVNNDITLFAVYSANACVVNYMAYQGADLDPIGKSEAFAYGDTITINPNGGTYPKNGIDTAYPFEYPLASETELVTPKKTDAKFLGWSYADNTFTAIWGDNTYVIHFDANGGEGTMADQVFVGGVEQALALNTFQKANSYFSGWNTEPDGSGESFTDGQYLTFTEGNLGGTLYAQWTTDAYGFTYYMYRAGDTPITEVIDIPYGTRVYVNPNGGSYYGNTAEYWGTVSEAPESRLLDANADRPGYTFLGWEYGTPGGNVTFTAQWSQDEYTVTFMNGGELVNTVKVNGGDSLADAYDLSDTDYDTFTGWYLNDEPYVFGTPVYEDLTLVAVWNAVTYQVTFHAGEDAEIVSGETVIEVAYGSTIAGSIPVVSREGYTFAGWYMTEECADGTEWLDHYTVLQSHDLYAKWTRDVYTITFNGNGGTIGDDEIMTQDIPTGEAANLRANLFVREGYTFAGWNAAADGSGKSTYQDGQKVSPKRNLTLYAQWEPLSYTFTFDPNGGELIYNGQTYTEPLEISVNFGEELIVPEVKREGYAFVTWLENNTAVNYVAGETVTYLWLSDRELVADWSLAPYTLTFDANGGTFKETGEARVQLSTTYETVYPAAGLSVPERDGYTFVGWSTGNDKSPEYKLGVDIPAAEVLAETDTLYAVWKTNSYTVTFNYNDGSDPVEVSVYYNKKVAEPEDPTRDGWTFDGWYIDGEVTPTVYDFSTPVTEDISLSASWTPILYTVEFNSMGGSEVATYTNLRYGQTIEAPEEPKLEGMTFVGWFKDPDCTIPWDFAKDTVNGNWILYARWTGTQYTVKFDANGGHAADNSTVYTTTVDYSYVAGLPASDYFTRSGYVFLGWSDIADGKLLIDASETTVTVKDSVTYYAVWAKVVDFGAIEAGTAPVQTVDFADVVNYAPESESYRVQLNAQDNSIVTINPRATLTPSAKPYEELIALESQNGYTYYIKAVVKVNPAGIAITTDIYEQPYYTVDDTFTVYVSAAREQNLTLDIGNAQGALECVQALQEVDGMPGTYKAVYQVTKIPADALDLVFTVKDKFDSVATYEETLPLRTMVYVTVRDGDDEEVSIQTIELRDTEDASKSIALTWAGAGTATYYGAADKSGWDYVYVKTADGREVSLYTTTVSGLSITNAIAGDSGVVNVSYNFQGYTVAGTLYINDVAVSGVALSISGNYGDGVNLEALIDQAMPYIQERYPNAIQEEYALTVLGTDGKEIHLHTFGETTFDWGSANTIWVNVYATAGYYVTFDRADGSADTVIEKQFVKHGELAQQIADPTLTGFLFDGWYTDPACTQRYEFSTPVTDNITLYAKWSRNTYTVTFNTNYGSDFPADSAWGPQHVEYLGKVTEPVDPERPGWTFIAWYTDPACQDADVWDFDTDTVTGPMTLYAGWSQNQYSLTYNLHADNVIENADAFVNRTDLVYGEVIEQPADPVREGYTFLGWYYDSEYRDAVTFPITVERSYELHAKWDVTGYTITFNANGGEGDYPAMITVKHGATAGDQWPTSDPVLEGHTFLGWYLDEDGSGTLDEDETTGIDANTAIRQDMSLFAKWELNTYTVTFEAAGGVVVPPSQTVNHGDELVEPDEIVYGDGTQYVFGGWYTDNTFSKQWDFENDVVTAPMELVARWIPAVTVIFNTNGGVWADGTSDEKSVVVASGSTLTMPEEPTNGAYLFVGWFTEDGKWLDPWNFDLNEVTGEAGSTLTLSAGWDYRDGGGNFFNTTATSTYVRLQVENDAGELVAATGIEPLWLAAKDANGNTVGEVVQMREIKPGDVDWDPTWDTNYAYYTATYAELTTSITFELAAAGYFFNTYR